MTAASSRATLAGPVAHLQVQVVHQPCEEPRRIASLPGRVQLVALRADRLHELVRTHVVLEVYRVPHFPEQLGHALAQEQLRLLLVGQVVRLFVHQVERPELLYPDQALQNHVDVVGAVQVVQPDAAWSAEGTLQVLPAVDALAVVRPRLHPLNLVDRVLRLQVELAQRLLP